MSDRTSTGAMLVQGTAVGAQPQQPQQPMQTQFGAVPGAIPQQVMPMQQQHYGGAQPVQHYGGAQVHQVSTFTPQVAQVTSMKWDGGLCECFDDMEICLIGWLCSCVMYGQTKERAGTGASPDRAAVVFARCAMTELGRSAGRGLLLRCDGYGRHVDGHVHRVLHCRHCNRHYNRHVGARLARLHGHLRHDRRLLARAGPQRDPGSARARECCTTVLRWLLPRL